MEKTYMIIAFSSTHQAIHFEKKLLPQFAIELIPTPRGITASCGLSLKFERDDLQSVLKVLEDEEKTGLQLYQFISDAQQQKIIKMEWEA
ncbi:DUF3343 domain-containing protein [Fusibacter bizertensis]|jgi:Protein of unknown function (DUF3343).|uniref:DUF3343 domain-containing protein n=1 Tax=Fusibacter bizertensis TaxID=1488331 RepID=A0ABT6NFL6_9FIRM|nr:DUF3343 domain-containing protein [Fusibacter bizertensis]MDH8679209.1 DUF3343 domain-containing protein [Fusibacter bizertensis]